jgi:TolB-like protein/Tfp pilus assembly protein PilF
MKHCPECNRNYVDPTLSFCLQDGAPLIFGSAVHADDTTSISADFPSEAPTRHIDPHTTTPTESIRFPVSDQETPSKQRAVWLIAAAGVLLTGITGFIGYRYSNVPPPSQIESVAVLPFENGSGDPNLDYLSDGLSETLIDKLSELPQLKVIARSSSFRYRGEGLDLGDIADKLGVRAIVTGKVARIGDNLNVRVEMVDAAENRQVWSEQYDRKFADLIGIKQEIAQAASDKLRVKLSGAQQQQLAKKETVNPQAYELLLKGRYYFGKPGTDNLRRSIDNYEQSVAVDPNYALAFAELSLKYYILTGNSSADPKIYLPKAENAARKALSLDDDLAEAHLAISRVYVARWQWREGEAERKRAIELDPNNALAHDLYAQLLALMGRADESVSEGRRARELDPLSPFTASNLAYRLHFARRYEESIAESKKAIELDPNLDIVYVVLGYAYAANGQHKEAIKAFQDTIRLGDTSTSIQISLAIEHAKTGEVVKAREILKKLESTTEYVSSAELATLYAALGDDDAAFGALDKAYADHDLQMQFLKVDTNYDPLRDDPRFQEMLKKVGLA